jgi:carbon-monoxide dehydrogenase large subunit
MVGPQPPLVELMVRHGLLPREFLPQIEINSTLETLSPLTPLGVKGLGELPTLAAPAAVANAVMDALAPWGVRHIDTPLTAAKVWHALQAAGAHA